MYLKLLFVFIGQCAIAKVNDVDDIGDIPYENQVSDGKFTGLSSIQVSVKDYGEIIYEKVKLNDYGDIAYETSKKLSAGKDYGDIPFEKETSTVNIPEMVKALLGGREVPGMVKTGTPRTVLVTSWPTTAPSRVTTTPTTNSTELTVAPSLEFTGTMDEIQMRAKEDEQYIGEHAPSTIDDSLCNPKKSTCSTCRDASGYRVYCLVGTTTTPPKDLDKLVKKLVDLTKDYEDYNTPQRLNYGAWNKYIKNKYPLGWPYCITTSTTTPTPSPTDAPHELTGLTIAQCYVCGMLEDGIPQADPYCADSFMTRRYKKHCKFLNREGWMINGTGGFYMWGRWSGGCSMRFTDISDVYTQRTCRDKVTPAMGAHYVSRRMARLEYTLRNKKDGCMSSPTATLVPLSRGISLFSRFTVCVCSQPYCNRVERLSSLPPWHTVVFGLVTTYALTT